MTGRGVTPTPLNYELFYACASGTPAAVRNDLSAILNSGRLSNQALAAIHERHFCRAESAGAESQHDSRVHGELERAISYLKTAERDTSNFGSALMGYSDTLAEARDAQGLRGYIDGLVAETRAMEQKSRELEQKLKHSSGEIDKLKHNLHQARLEAMTDELTTIGNRKQFERSIHAAMLDAQISGQPLSLIFADVDRFKLFNDTWGHKLGDHVLILVAQVLKTLVAGKGVPTRYGGEEFAIVLPNVPLAEATAMAERIRLSISKKVMKTKSTGATLGRITMSFGVAQYVAGQDLDSFVGRADRALYEAKESGRNRVLIAEIES